jgi:hypothetical protein
MNAQERQLIDNLFDRLSKVEGAPRDADAESAIAAGLRRAPNATYALVQTALVQDEALRRANARIEELEHALGGQQPAAQPQSGSFLDSMRDALFGAQPPSHGSVPSIPPQDRAQEASRDTTRPVWNSGQVNSQVSSQANAQFDPRASSGGYGPAYGGAFGGGGGSSFLGTAAATAAGVIGGSLLMNSIRGLMGGHQAFAGSSMLSGGENRTPWTDQSDSRLAQDAGINDIGRSDRLADDSGRNDPQQGFFDQASNDGYADNDDDSDYDNSDDDSFGSDDSDVA